MLEIAPQSFDVRPDGGRFDSSKVLAPEPIEVEKAARHQGLNLRVGSKSDGSLTIAAHDLSLCTVLETQFGDMTVAEAVAHPEFQRTGKMRVQAPFRDSSSWAAFLSLGHDGRPFVHDSGTCITHWPSNDDWRSEAAKVSTTGLLHEIDSCRAGHYLSNEPAPVRWLLVGILSVGIVCIIVAPGGTGKSWWLIQLGASVATGINLADTWEVGETGGVLMLLAEDDASQIQRRLHQLVAALPPRQYSEVRERLHDNLIVIPRVAESNLLTATSPHSREVEITALVNEIVEAARQIPNLKLIVIDPVSRFRGGEENSAQDTTRFVEAMERIAKGTGATVIAAHHSNKAAFNSGEPNQSASRGSSALSDGVRWQMNLTTFTEKDARQFGIPIEERGFHLTATITKNNYAPPQPSVYLKRSTGGYLTRSNLAPLASVKTESLSTSSIDLVRSELKLDRRYSKTAFVNQFAGENRQLRAGNNRVREVVQELLDSGRLVLDSNKKLAPPPRAKVEIS